MSNVIVTGGSRGLGLAIGRKLVKAGYDVIAIARREGAELAAAGLETGREKLGRLHFKQFDLAEIAGIHELIKGVRKEFGPIYGLVNNAALGTGGVLATMHDARIESLVHLNVVSPIILTKYVVRSMMADHQGRIINISSVVASTGYSGLAAYSATKAALVGFTRSLAREVGQLGVTVNAIAPGFADTDMTQELGEGAREQIARRSALRRLIEPEDVARAVEFLLSEGARNITGTVLTVDAGNTT